MLTASVLPTFLALTLGWLVGGPSLAVSPTMIGTLDEPAPVQEGDDPVNADLSAVVEGNTRFALDLFERLRSEEAGNLFFSPSSLSTALAMTFAGAEGETAEQMARVLHFSIPPDRLHPAFAALRKAGSSEPGGDDKARPGVELNTANRLWGQRDFDFRADFLALTRDEYGAELALVDFRQAAEQAREQVNSWVEGQTNGKITDLLAPGVVDAMTRLVLTNAVYFKGAWTDPFRPEATRDEPFHLSASQQVDVPLMTRKDQFRFAKADGLKLLELPYGAGEFSMVVLLPDEVDGLSGLEARLTPEALNGWLRSLFRREVLVDLPRFSMTSEFQLNDVLGAMGMDLAFTAGRADFSGMSTEEELVLSAVVHKAFVDVNEEGTEAAAATGIAVGVTSFVPPKDPETFRADHPFLFLIRDRRTSNILFLGRLVDPRS